MCDVSHFPDFVLTLAADSFQNKCSTKQQVQNKTSNIRTNAALAHTFRTYHKRC